MTSKFRPSAWSQTYTPPKHPEDPNFRTRKGMQGPEEAAWRNFITIEHAREVLGLAFDEFDSLTRAPWRDEDEHDEAVVALVARHGAAPDPWGEDPL